MLVYELKTWVKEKSTIFSCIWYLENWENTFARRENKIGCLQQHFHSRNNSDVFIMIYLNFILLKKLNAPIAYFSSFLLKQKSKVFQRKLNFLPLMVVNNGWVFSHLINQQMQNGQLLTSSLSTCTFPYDLIQNIMCNFGKLSYCHYYNFTNIELFLFQK